MKQYSVADIQKRIRVALDENNQSTSLSFIGDVDTLSIDELIRSKIEDGAKLVIEASPLSRLYGSASKASRQLSIVWHTDNGLPYGGIILPSDFLRLVSFKMSDWQHSVSDVISPSSPLYSQQYSPYGGVKGNPQRPVVAIRPFPSGQMLEFFSCKNTSAIVSELYYVPIPLVVTSGDVEYLRYSEDLYSAMIYKCASLVALSLGDDGRAKWLDEVCKNLLIK